MHFLLPSRLLISFLEAKRRWREREKKEKEKQETNGQTKKKKKKRKRKKKKVLPQIKLSVSMHTPLHS